MSKITNENKIEFAEFIIKTKPQLFNRFNRKSNIIELETINMNNSKDEIIVFLKSNLDSEFDETLTKQELIDLLIIED